MARYDLRLDDDLAAHIDQRARKLGLSRTEWMKRVLTHAVEQPLQERAVVTQF